MGALDDTMGVTFVGVLMAAVLYGVSCVQIFYYFVRFPTDWWHLKLLVSAVWVFDTIHQALISHTVYTYVITNFGNAEELGSLVWSLIIEVLFNGFTALLVQSFFVLRIWKLSERNLWLTTPTLLLVIGEFGAVLVYVIEAMQLETFEQLAGLKPLSMTVNALAAAGDVLIAAILCTMLHRSRTGFKRSDTLINKLILFTINTGFLTSVCAVLSLITIVALPNTFIYICFYFTLGRLYSNSLLATLNARKLLRDRSAVGEVLSLELQHTSTGQMPSPGGIAIRVDTTKEFARDNASQSSRYDEPSVKAIEV
ncbi:hypothetical protein CERSUDRAFT_91852 [Gelatoporia subvermispora B]|uniref:DUF6534 domain-containing protein n=1 Tax=Ceriporiopsis subvermispora (strain B) TaxID=914234 RepID=M2PWA0_CERS8|nr:hypothetical protein CERSUDRAFT_91852 [Gelatoporia subvermispora B]